MFRFKQFEIDDRNCGMKLGTDSVALGAWTEIPSDARTALDVGAGSGILSLMLAQRSARLAVTALEYDSGAGTDCRKNLEASPWASRLNLVEGDFRMHCPERPVDLIISNPPYFTGGPEAPLKERALARHEGGLNYFSLVEYSARWLSAEGTLSMILPAEKYDDALFRAEMARLKLRRLAWLEPSAGKAPIRVMMQFYRTDGHCAVESVAIRDNAGITPLFSKLTADFYL
ncbi:MAG: methyltransferase [Muribaculaceae bacterium]|nr:methyltransferase [Muribaculaceae bacterium]MDE6332082.1 methyltransferase [Muribaculaceae bacterium]